MLRHVSGNKVFKEMKKKNKIKQKYIMPQNKSRKRDQWLHGIMQLEK